MTIAKNSSSLSKNHKSFNKNRFSPLDFTLARPSSSGIKIVSNPVDIEPLELDDLIMDEETEEWIVQNKGKNKKPLEIIEEEPTAHKFDRIFFFPSGVFLVRFGKKADQEAVLQQGHFLFDNKPLIVRPWSEQEPLTKAEVKVVPVWIKLLNLPLKFWGNCIPRIAGLMRDFVKCDGATSDRTRLGFTCVMIDVPFGSPVPGEVRFLDEEGQLVVIKVEAEWNPILCHVCKGIGHEGKTCVKVKSKQKLKQKVVQRWQPKPQVPPRTQPTVQGTPRHPSAAPIPNPNPSPACTPVEQQYNLQVSENSNGTSRMATPTRPVIRLSRQELLDKGFSSVKFGNQSFLEALNNATPRFGIEIQERKVLWSKLCSFASLIQGPWIICGDFNTVLKHAERLGDQSTEEEMTDFQDCIDMCGVLDIAAMGSYFTWNNKQEPSTRVYSRLDRVLVNHDWLKYSIEVTTDYPRSLLRSKVDQFLPCIHATWSSDIQGTLMFKVVRRPKLLKRPLKELNQSLIADIENNAIRAWQNLESIQQQLSTDPCNHDLINMEIHAAKEYRELQEASDSFLLQNSKASWLCEGDCNSKMFHNYIKGRQVRNKVLRIADEQGNWVTATGQIQQAFLNFYQKLLGRTVDVRPINFQVVQRGRVCSLDQWTLLLSPITSQEIKEAVFSIPSHKAPDPDGYFSAFFKDAWSIVGPDLCSAVHDFFRTGKLLKQVNHTMVTLIPKVAILGNVTQFRPISCCNVVYKVISKLLCTRLAMILPTIISPNQGGFIKGRNIVENILALNFPPHFIKLVMECVSTASYSIALKAIWPASKDCNILVEKIVEKIRAIGARKLTYAGRLVIVKSVLVSLYTYWSNIFLIPKCVLKKIDNICRNYILDGTSDYMRSPVVAWQQVCLPKTEGGLGIRYSQDWNIATMGKLKAICKVRDIFQAGYSSGKWLANGSGYIVCSGYEWLRHKEQKVGWAKLIWHKWMLPKHSFYCWLLFKNALNVKDKLFRHGITTDDICCVCHVAQETVVHLLQHCHYGQLILKGVCQRLHISEPAGNAIIWIGRRKWSNLKRKTCLLAIMAFYYYIWQQRNSARLNALLCSPEVIIEQIMKLVKNRMQQHCIGQSDKLLFNSIT
ncbi:uncharacterized protein LOC141640806 [Silene latifolia]|uniref:uncharacterized protein LOC141640806 n=1 Tax=Silene latifolia TaxID=37657 RepID=UPI003D76B651